MGGIGPAPKPAAQRRRRNIAPGARTLRVVDDLDVPELPTGQDWQSLTRRYWADIWASPMAPEYDASDINGLFMLIALVDLFWQFPNKELAAEIRLQRQSFGLSPIDRRRLQWEIDRGEQAQQASEQRRAKQPSIRKVVDPRLAEQGSPSSTRRSARTSATGSKST